MVKPNHFTRLFVLSFVSRSFCSRVRRYSISLTTSATISSMRRRSASTGLSFSVAWIADQSFASAPISMSSSTWRLGLSTYLAGDVSIRKALKFAQKRGVGGGFLHTSGQNILEAYFERGVGVRREDCPLLARDVLGLPVIVADRVPDLDDRVNIIPVRNWASVSLRAC